MLQQEAAPWLPEQASNDPLKLLPPAPSQTLSEISRCFTVARQAKCTQVVEVALTASFRHRQNVIRIPKRSARSDRLHPIQ